VVQYEAEIHGSWHPVVRYDTSHGFAHRDLMYPDGSVDKQPLLFESYNLALTFATQELKQNWQRYRHNGRRIIMAQKLNPQVEYDEAPCAVKVEKGVKAQFI